MKPIIGIDIGGSFTKASLVKDGAIVYSTRAETVHTNEKAFFDSLFKLINEILKKNKLAAKDIRGIGVGIAGMVLADLGVVVSALNLGLVNVPLAKIISEKYGVEVRIGNDIGMFALAEQAASGLDNFVYVAVGTGINVSIINRGQLFSGSQGASIEFGHTSMSKKEGTGVLGKQCTCGLGTCVESFVSGKAIMAAAKESGIKAARPEDVFAHESVAALDIIDDFFHSINAMLINICNTYRPQAIFLGGGLAPLIAPNIEQVNCNLARCNYGYKNAPAVQVKMSELSYFGGALGAALLLGQTIKSEPVHR